MYAGTPLSFLDAFDDIPRGGRSGRYSSNRYYGGNSSRYYDRYSSSYNRYDRYGDGGYDRYDDDYRNERDIEFFRPDGTTEGKTIQWCKDNGFFQVSHGLWSGNWYYDFHPCVCPIAGCQERFKTEEDVNKHLKFSTGKAHVKYRDENNIGDTTKIDEVFGGFTTKESKKSAKTISKASRPIAYDYDDYDDDAQMEAHGLESETETLRKLACQRIRAREQQRKAAPKPSEEEEPPKKKVRAGSTPTLTTSSDAPKKKKCAFAILMKSGGVAKKKATPKKKAPVVPVVSPPKQQNDGPPVVETVYAFYAKNTKKDEYSYSAEYKIAGFEFHYSDLSTKKFGRTVGTKKSDSMDLLEKEFITAIDVEKEHGDDVISSVRFYTNHWSGRYVSFKWGDETGLYDPFQDGGHQCHTGDFNAKTGRMITGIKMSRGEITGILDEELPEGFGYDD